MVTLSASQLREAIEEYLIKNNTPVVRPVTFNAINSAHPIDEILFTDMEVSWMAETEQENKGDAK